MKQLVVLGTLATATLIASAAYAQPADQDGAAPTPERHMPAIYVGAGGEFGGNLNLMTGVYVEGGLALHRNTYLHARLAHGDVSDLGEAVGPSSMDSFAQGNSRYTQVRAGLEQHACTSRGVACLIYGADLGILATSDTTGPTTATPSYMYLEESLIPRAGVDVGGRHLRARFMVETAVGASQRHDESHMPDAHTYGLQGAMLGGGVAYNF